MKFSALATALSLLGASQAAPQTGGAGNVSKFQELSLAAPHDYRAGSYINMWFHLNIAQYQAPHAAYTEDQWLAYAAGQCLADPNKFCYSFNTYLLSHDGGVTGTDLSWWVVEYFDNLVKESDYGHSGDAHVTNSRIFNIKR